MPKIRNITARNNDFQDNTEVYTHLSREINIAEIAK